MDPLVEAGFGSTLFSDPAGIVWTDITRRVDVAEAGVQINRGASDELAQIPPGTCTMLLDNSDGALSPGRSGSPFYPHVRKGTPIRVSVADLPVRTGSAPYPLSMLGDAFDEPALSSLWANAYGGAGVTNGRARIPVNPGSGSGLQSVRQWTLTGGSVCARLTTLPAVNGSSSVRINFLLDSQTSGTRIGWQYNAVAGTLRAISEVGFSDGASTDLTYSPSAHLWVRVREAAGTVYWETSGDGASWTVRRSMATPAWAGTDTLMVSFTSARTGGSADYAEWDLLGAIVYSRFWGAINQWPTKWQGLYAKTYITCSDMFALLSRQPQLRPALDEEVLRDGPAAYYPLTEPSGSTSAGDLSGVTAGALALTQIGLGGELNFGSIAVPRGTGESVPDFAPATANTGKYLTADLGTQFESLSTGMWVCVEAWIHTTIGDRIICALTSSDGEFQLALSLSATGVLQIETVTDGVGPLTVYTTTSGALHDGVPHHVVYDEFTGEVWVDGVEVTAPGIPSMNRLRILTVGGFKSERLWAGSIGHIALYATASATIAARAADHYEAGMTGFEGETADLRIARLAGYAGVTSVTVFGAAHDVVAGQGGGGASALSMMQTVETTEAGKLYAERDWLGLAYQSRDVRYNPDPASEVFTISYADLETGDVELADDDQKQVNTIVASRPDGARQRVISQPSIDLYGPYDPGEMTLLKTTDAGVLDAANWMVSRYADPPPELREVPIEAYTLAQYPDILDGEISEYFSVTDMPAEALASEMRVTIEGYAETIWHNRHRIVFRTSRSATDSVWILGDAVYGVLGSTTRLAY